MSYLALARKWRPNQFKQVVGQAHVLTALENALSQNKLHHAYLFSGTRGVGKTTIGRLFAKGLNCETGITATPCGQCDACKEIDEGRFVDLLEIDAASRTKVEDTRELLDNVQYKPARGRFKVYLIDEVHMLSRHSFNALLKTLEEPPEYVKFLLATTDPQKLPVTILSRCLQFHLKPISVDNIHEQLNFILGHENVTAEQRALGMIAHSADGSMRDALSLTDQAIALGNGSVNVDTVSTMLGTLDTDQAIYLLEAIGSKQAQTAMAVIQELASNGVDWDILLQELASQLHRIAMYQALPSTLDKTKPDAERITLLSQHLSPEDVQLYYQIALKGRQDLPFAPTERTGLEMTVLRMIAFRPVKVNVATAIDTNQPVQQSVVQSTAQSPVPQSAPVAVNSVQTTANTEKSVASAPAIMPTAQPVSVAPAVNTQPASSAVTEQPPLPTEDDYPVMAHDYEQEPYALPDTTEYQQVSQRGNAPAAVTTQPMTAKKAGLRHQLRSKRANVASNTGGDSTKKPKAALSNNVLDRVAQQHGSAKAMPHSEVIASSQEKPEENQPYQWRASKVEVIDEKNDLTPSQLKQALEHTKTAEMTTQLVNESIEKDTWAALINTLEIAKLVEQLALNSAYSKQGSTIELFLRAQQAHLNTDKAQNELLQALNQSLGEQCHLTVEISTKGQTPLELRESLYQEKLQAAHSALESDPNVQFIQARFAAELDSDSVRPI